MFPPIPIIINLHDKQKDISLNSIAYMGMWKYVPGLGDFALGLELVGPGRRLYDILSVDDDDISTAVGVPGSDVVI